MHRYTEGPQQSPAAGHDLSFIPSTGDSFQLLTLRAKLVTSAVVANRFPHFQIVNPSGQVLHEVVSVAAQAASATVTYDLCGRNGAAFQGGAVSDTVSSLALPDVWWPADCTIRTVTTAIDVADQWSAIYWTALIGDEWDHLRLLEQIASQLGG